MENTKTEFVEDIQKLLSSYFEKSELKHFLQKINKKDNTTSSLEVINKFYAQQLNIKYNFAQDRMEIDRTITFAMKNLPKEKYLQLLRKLGQICTGHGKLNLAYEVLSKAVKESETQNDKAESLLLLADVHSRRAEWKKSVEALESAEDFFRSAGDNAGISQCENMLGSIYGEKGELENAKNHFEKSLALIDPGKQKEMAASLEGNLGIIENIQGNYVKSLDYFIKALRKFESLSDFRRIAELKHNIGMLHVNQEHFIDAIVEFDQCIEIASRESLLPVLALAYHSKASVLIKQTDFDGAVIFADKAMEVSHQIDDKLTIAEVYKTKSQIEKHSKNYEKAENYLLASLLLNEKMKNVLNIAESCVELAKLYDEMNRKNEKEEYLQRSLKYFREIQAFDNIQKVEEMLTMQN